MKKLLVALLCAIMLLCCVGAVAEENGFETFGQFVFEVNENNRCNIRDYVLEEGQTELFIPRKIDGKKVSRFEVSTLPESVKTVYYSEECGWRGECADGRELVLFQYVDFEWVQNDSWYSKYLTDMGEDDYALVWANCVYWKDGESREKEAGDLYAEQLPTELDGHKMHIKMANSQNVIYTTDGWQYKLDTYDNDFRAEIVGSSIPADAKEAVIPNELDGYPVKRVWLEAIPESVELVYMEDDAYFDHNGVTRTIKTVRYEEYEDVQADDWKRGRVPDMTENDLALMNAWQYTYSADSSESGTFTVYAADLPTELLGKRCLNGLANDYVLYTSGEWTYSYYSDGIKVVDVALEGEQPILYVPSVIDGKMVESISSNIAHKHGVKLFVVPQYSWLDGSSKAEFGVLNYYDRAWVESRNDDYYTKRYAWMGENDLSIEGYTHYVDGANTDATIEYKDIPTEIAGKKLINNMYFDDNVTVHKKDDFSYVLLSDDTIAITKYDNQMAKSLIIPARIDGKTVTALMGDTGYWVINNSDLTSLELPSTLKVIGKRAIYAWSLKKLDIPAGVKEIGESAIHCYKLSAVKLPEGVTKLGKNWLYGRTKSVTIPASVTTLEANAFSDADYVASVKLPDTVTNVGVAAFSEMGKLSSLTLPNTMVEIPERLAAASERLAKITIPANTEIIGKQAFAGCVKLSSITFAKKDAKIKTIGEGAFSGTALGKLALPEGATSIGKEAFQGCTKLNNVALPSTLTAIDRYAFSGCTALSKIALPEGLTTIAEGTFMGCKKLASVTIPASVTSIEDFAFEGCSAKLTLTVEEGSFAQQWAAENGYAVKIAKAK